MGHWLILPYHGRCDTHMLSVAEAKIPLHFHKMSWQKCLYHLLAFHCLKIFDIHFITFVGSIDELAEVILSIVFWKRSWFWAHATDFPLVRKA